MNRLSLEPDRHLMRDGFLREADLLRRAVPQVDRDARRHRPQQQKRKLSFGVRWVNEPRRR